ncbi:kinase-like protein [Choiromyces venosus 120613-1]|uniref:non-specific serine/threonine protein kinase n=1 Tax=Choiromyces venosus 120613-1 TaxID=1336337 RepID=A0A3N4JNI5_9PEZI|nr:kinase-like protein [Choiromyces venosus 120613-1]
MDTRSSVPQTNHFNANSVDPFRLKSEYDGNAKTYDEYPPGQAVEKWTVDEFLGSGGFSVVYKHVLEGTDRVRAVKSIQKSGYKFHAREFNIMTTLSKSEHRYLFVELLGWFENNDRLFIAMEYLEHGDLRKNLDKPFAEEVVQKITKQVLNGLQVMHENDIAHRDLKPENIFVVCMSPVWVKLGDFGISKCVHNNTAFRSKVGTDCYAAPEVLRLDTDAENPVYTNAVDIWALGCVVYELLTGEVLFGSLGETSKYYHTKVFPEQKLCKLTAPTSDTVKSFIQRLVVLNSDGRPSAAQAAGDVWLEDVIPLTEIREPQHDLQPSSVIQEAGTLSTSLPDSEQVTKIDTPFVACDLCYTHFSPAPADLRFFFGDSWYPKRL